VKKKFNTYQKRQQKLVDRQAEARTAIDVNKEQLNFIVSNLESQLREKANF